MVSEGHQGGQEVQDDRQVDEGDLFPSRVGDSFGAGGREGRALRPGVPYCLFGWGHGRRVLL